MIEFLCRLRRILGLISTAALWASGAGLVAMTAAVAWQVFGRYVLNSTPSWTEPVVLLLMSWFILLGAAVGVREGFHLGLDLLRHVAPAPVVRVMDALSLVAVAGFGVAMSWYGAALMIGTWRGRIAVLGIPSGLEFVPLVCGGALIALFALERLVVLAIGGPAPAEAPAPVEAGAL